jgi:hypothetical protein
MDIAYPAAVIPELVQQKFAQELANRVSQQFTTLKFLIFMIVTITHKFRAATFLSFCG